MYYSGKDSDIQLTRQEVWLNIGGDPAAFDKYGVYCPEDDSFAISRIAKISTG